MKVSVLGAKRWHSNPTFIKLVRTHGADVVGSRLLVMSRREVVDGVAGVGETFSDGDILH